MGLLRSYPLSTGTVPPHVLALHSILERKLSSREQGRGGDWVGRNNLPTIICLSLKKKINNIVLTYAASDLRLVSQLGFSYLRASIFASWSSEVNFLHGPRAQFAAKFL